jgi:hypothetical protein
MCLILYVVFLKFMQSWNLIVQSCVYVSVLSPHVRFVDVALGVLIIVIFTSISTVAVIMFSFRFQIVPLIVSTHKSLLNWPVLIKSWCLTFTYSGIFLTTISTLIVLPRKSLGMN